LSLAAASSSAIHHEALSGGSPGAGGCACAGDHGVIAKETARMLGLGTNIQDASGLPTMEADGKIPKDLGKKYGKMILEADGFAQVGGVH
jgi:hypothetical protein